MEKKRKIKIKHGLVLCENCDNPASWELSVKVGWIGCAPCITGKADSFDVSDLIHSEYKDEFLKELKVGQNNKIKENENRKRN